MLSTPARVELIKDFAIDQKVGPTDDVRHHPARRPRHLHGARDISQKQLQMAGLLFELCHDLAIAPEDNVPRIAGFESLG